MKSPTKKLVASINQSISGYLIHIYFQLSNRAKEANIYTIKSRIQRLQILIFLYFSSFLIQENQVFSAEDKVLQKVVIAEEELHYADVDDIGNFCLDLCSSMTMNVGILKWSINGGELTRIIS